MSVCRNAFELSCRYNPKPDGNCEFASLSDQLKYKLNVDIGHEDLRRVVVKHLRNDKTAMHFVDEPWSSYLKKMDLLGTYGDHITLVTVAVLYEVQIIILSSTETATLVSCKGNADFDPIIRCLFIGHFPEGQGEHYVSLEHQTDLLNFCMSKLAFTHIPTSCSRDNAAGMPVNTTRHSPRETGTQMPE